MVEAPSCITLQLLFSSPSLIALEIFLYIVCTMPTEVREVLEYGFATMICSTVSILECMRNVSSGYETIYQMNLSNVSNNAKLLTMQFLSTLKNRDTHII